MSNPPHLVVIPSTEDPAVELIREFHAVADRMSQMVADAKKEAGEVTKREVGLALRDLPRAVNALVLVQYRWLYGLVGLGGVVVGALICGASVYFSLPRVPEMSCSAQRGGVACGYWVTPPTEPVPAQTGGKH